MGVAQILIDKGINRQALFFVHLSVEKALKALVCRETSDIPPRTHNLVRLAELAKLEMSGELKDTLEELTRHRDSDYCSDDFESPVVNENIETDSSKGLGVSVDESVVASTRRYLRSLANDNIDVRFGILFGSHARGQAGEWSDIDLVVVSPRFDHDRTHDSVMQLWRAAGRTDSRIEPIACGEREWETDDERVIIEIARREGVRIDLDN